MCLSSLRDHIASLPKAELHVHLEGSLTPATIRELDPLVSVETVRERRLIHSFPDFIDAFKWAVGFLRTPDDFALATRRLLESLAAQNVRYAEITLSAGVILWRKQDFAAIYDAVTREAAKSSVDAWWVLDGIRHFGPEHVMECAKLAADRAGDRVVAFGVGGDETRGPAEWFADAFALAKSAGLGLVPHAGETAGPESVWSAVRMGADRIGHGIRAIDDPALVDWLRDHRIPLEVCLTSNLCTGAVARIDEHPVRRLFDAGVDVVLNSDDPGLFGATVNGEYELAAERFGFTPDELTGLAAGSLRAGLRHERDLTAG